MNRNKGLLGLCIRTNAQEYCEMEPRSHTLVQATSSGAQIAVAFVAAEITASICESVRCGPIGRLKTEEERNSAIGKDLGVVASSAYACD